MPAISARKVITLMAGQGKITSLKKPNAQRMVNLKKAEFCMKRSSDSQAVVSSKVRPLKPHRKLQLLRIQYLVAQEKCSQGGV